MQKEINKLKAEMFTRIPCLIDKKVMENNKKVEKDVKSVVNQLNDAL